MDKVVSRIPHQFVPGIADTVRAQGGTTIYVSGIVGVDEEGNPPRDFAEQSRLAGTTLIASLAKQGAKPSDIVRLNVYVVDLDEERTDTWHRARDEKFALEDAPASTLLGVARLYSPDAWIEIEATAVIG